MISNPFHRAIYLTGPTASGKTAVGVALAKNLDAEVVALDSMTLYRGMNIGTAKPTLQEQCGIPHHLIDVLDPWGSGSVADYRNRALSVLLDIESRARRVLFVGGTALYLKALLRGLFEGPAAIPELRHSLEDEATRRGNTALHARLVRLDPMTAARLHPQDRRRVIRALEVIAATGRSIGELQKEQTCSTPVDVPVIALMRSSETLNDRIHRRVARMFAGGLVEEVHALLNGPKPLGRVPAESVGYREVIEYLAGLTSLSNAMVSTQKRTRRYAKHQATWFRGLAEVKLYQVKEDEPPEVTAGRLAVQIEFPS